MSISRDKNHFTEPTTSYWQGIIPPDVTGTGSHHAHASDLPSPPYQYGYPARLPDDATLLLPIRPLPDQNPPTQAVASLIINQASLPVIETLGIHLAALLAPYAPDIIVALPTLGLSLAPVVAKALSHNRYVPMGYSVKFWYEQRLSVAVSSVTSPSALGVKRLYLDPNLLPLLTGEIDGRRRRVALVDDAVSSGTTVLAAKKLLEEIVGVNVVVIGVAMRQGNRWKQAMGTEAEKVVGVFDCPLLRAVEGGWGIGG